MATNSLSALSWETGTAGLLYASDLVWAFLGSVVLYVVLIPVLGLLENCVLAGLLKLSSLLLIATWDMGRQMPAPLR